MFILYYSTDEAAGIAKRPVQGWLYVGNDKFSRRGSAPQAYNSQQSLGLYYKFILRRTSELHRSLHSIIRRRRSNLEDNIAHQATAIRKRHEWPSIRSLGADR
jgi:hypothetical protein